MSSDSRDTYQLSGAMGNGLFMAPLAGLLAGAIGSFVYAYVTVYSPVVGVVSALFVLGLGFGVGMVIGWGGKAGHCRNAMFLHAVGFVVGLVTLYISWVCFEWVLLRRGDEPPGFAGLINLALSPGVVWEIAKSIAETGWYSVGSTDVSGIGSWITWILEAIAIVGLITFSAGTMIGDAVYCEQTDAWVPKRDGALRLQLPESQEQIVPLTEGDLDAIESLPAAHEHDFPRFQLELWMSDQSPDTAAFQLKLETPNVEDGKVTIKQADFTPQFKATREEILRLAALADRPVVVPELTQTEPTDAGSTATEGSDLT